MSILHWTRDLVDHSCIDSQHAAEQSEKMLGSDKDAMGL